MAVPVLAPEHSKRRVCRLPKKTNPFGYNFGYSTCRLMLSIVWRISPS